ncbi:hypothetical protein JTB14_004226 [Gonioctena quinquepunctata]|nr:hypothetical protein JTB14_004226 [Gonioctena quinquepunctata]
MDSYSHNLNEFEQLNSRLHHISGRIYELVTEDNIEVEAGKLSYMEMLELEGDLAAKITGASSAQTFTPTGSNQQPPLFNFPKPVLPYECDIHFSGDSRKESLVSFPKKVDVCSFKHGLGKTIIAKCSGIETNKFKSSGMISCIMMNI